MRNHFKLLQVLARIFGSDLQETVKNALAREIGRCLSNRGFQKKFAEIDGRLEKYQADPLDPDDPYHSTCTTFMGPRTGEKAFEFGRNGWRLRPSVKKNHLHATAPKHYLLPEVVAEKQLILEEFRDENIALFRRKAETQKCRAGLGVA